MRRPRAVFAVALLLGAAVLACPAAARADRMQDAESRFQRGVELYNEGNFDAAQIEFARAYDLVPAYKILFNMGQVAFQRQDYVAAVEHFRRYLREGGDAIPAERRQAVEADIPRLEQRVGRLEIVTAERGAEVLIDDLPAGVTPLLQPVRVNVGRRRVQLSARGGDRQTRLVDVAGGETARVTFAQALPRLDPALHADGPAMSLAASPAARPAVARAGGGRRVPWVAWTSTLVLGAGAAGAGVMAVSASRELEQMRGDYPLMTGALDNQAWRVQTLSWIADGLLAGAVLGAVIATYLTLRAPPAEQ